jgi:hypothetical protein
MKGSRHGLLIIVSGGLLLSWVYAWAAFVMPFLDTRPFSLMDGVLVLVLAATITKLPRGRGWRIVSIIGLQIVGFVFATLRMIYGHFEWSYSFWSRDWVSTFLAQQHSLLEWTIIILILFWTLSLWIGGIKLVLKSPDEETIGSRFDLGVAAFLLLLLIRLMMIVKGVAVGHDEGLVLSFLAFFVFGILGLGMVRYADSAERTYIATYRGIGVILSFTVFVLLFGGGLVILFLRSLMSAAELGQDVLKAAAKSVVPLLTTVIRFILVKGCRIAPDNNSSAKPQNAGPELPVSNGSEVEFLAQILTWIVTGLGSVIALIFLVLLVWYLTRWLASRRPTDENKPSIWHVILQWLSLFKALLISSIAIINRKRRRHQGAGYFFARLLRWGAHCGLPRIPNETPLEYGSRLGKEFPNLGNEITSIIDLFNRTVYGVMDLNLQRLATARLAWYRLRSPLLWAARLKTWFISSGV